METFGHLHTPSHMQLHASSLGHPAACKSPAGTAVLISCLNVGARYFSIILLISGTYSGLNLQLSWETTLVPAPRSKKATLIAIANCVSQTSHWFSPYFFPTSQEPFYRLGGGLILFGCLMTVILSLLIKARAKKLDKMLGGPAGECRFGMDSAWERCPGQHGLQTIGASHWLSCCGIRSPDWWSAQDSPRSPLAILR